jgi:folate-dependent phosphoribosylglycinamide formyltransferase PurN
LQVAALVHRLDSRTLENLRYHSIVGPAFTHPDQFELDHYDLILLAGYRKLFFIPDWYDGWVLNIHPSLLPKHGGLYGDAVHESVLRSKDTESGCTVHFANNEYDSGPIILQRTCPVLVDDTVESLKARVFIEECIAYPEAIKRITNVSV